MAVIINGKQVHWGIPSAVKSASDALIEGIVDDVRFSRDGSTTEITDEDGDIVTRVDHGEKTIVTLTTRITATNPILPGKGDEVTFSAAIDGVALDQGRSFVESAETTYKGNDTSTASITIHHYPEMLANPV